MIPTDRNGHANNHHHSATPPECDPELWSGIVVCPDAIRIDPDFASLIPPLSKSELAFLEESLKQEGLREPLILWEETGVLLDGHNRLGLCRKLGIAVRVIYRSFPDRAAVSTFLLCLQLARRNLSAEAISYLRGRRYLEEKKSHGGARTQPSGHGDHLKTAARLAREFRVGEKTIRRDAQLVLAVDEVLHHCGESARTLLLSRDFGLRRSQILRLARTKPAEQRKALGHLQSSGMLPKRKRASRKPRSITLPKRTGSVC